MIEEVLERVARASRRVLLLDYDGTLVRLVRRPELASPDDDLKRLLTKLGTSPGTEVQLVSGRMRSQVESWFADLPIGLHSDHGYWSRPSAKEPWRRTVDVSLDFLDAARPILRRFTEAVPGTFVEEKSVSLAWHYRGVEEGEQQAPLLIRELEAALKTSSGEVLRGSKVVEVRARGVSKALVAKELAAHAEGPSWSRGDDGNAISIPDAPISPKGDDEDDPSAPDAPRMTSSSRGDDEDVPSARDASRMTSGNDKYRPVDANALIIALGDDRTDEDLFRALPPSAITIHVGSGESIAKFRLEDVAQVRELLRAIAETPDRARRG